MKNSSVAILVLGAVVATAVVQEWRMGELKKSLVKVEGTAAPERETSIRPSHPDVREEPRRINREADKEEAASENDGQGFTKGIRKMWDNPAGKSMMSQGVKVAVAMMYEDYIATLDLSDEEAKHFRELLGSGMAIQQEFGMKMMGASAEERKELAKEMAERSKQNEEDIKVFLNNDEDFEAFQSYKARLPEKQQLEGVRATMAARGTAMDEATESRLIEAMHKARTQPGLADFSGKDAMLEMGEGDMVARFEESWESQQALLRNEVGFLNELQKEAFFQHQEQMKEFQLMSLKMAKEMMKKNE